MNPNRASTTAPTEGQFRLLPPRGPEPVLVSNQVGAFDKRTTGNTGLPTPVAARGPYNLAVSLRRRDPYAAPGPPAGRAAT